MRKSTSTPLLVYEASRRDEIAAFLCNLILHTLATKKYRTVVARLIELGTESAVDKHHKAFPRRNDA